jgi:hypothetical protein
MGQSLPMDLRRRLLAAIDDGISCRAGRPQAPPMDYRDTPMTPPKGASLDADPGSTLRAD